MELTGEDANGDAGACMGDDMPLMREHPTNIEFLHE
jgi:hypothetical protein